MKNLSVFMIAAVLLVAPVGCERANKASEEIKDLKQKVEKQASDLKESAEKELSETKKKLKGAFGKEEQEAKEDSKRDKER